jgi:ABC-type transporter Mla maintaining outer membrane lipid asymmetry permease subunit MlaE
MIAAHVAGAVSLFTGAVAAIQAAYQFTGRADAGSWARSCCPVIIELSPALTGLVVGGRVGRRSPPSSGR